MYKVHSWCLVVYFFKELTRGAPWLTWKSELWSVYCEFIMWTRCSISCYPTTICQGSRVYNQYHYCVVMLPCTCSYLCSWVQFEWMLKLCMYDNKHILTWLDLILQKSVNIECSYVNNDSRIVLQYLYFDWKYSEMLLYLIRYEERRK